jgi:UV DNA damage endonuclease
MRIGYACLTYDVEGTTIRTCRLASATQERLASLVSQNLAAIDRMLEYNRANRVRMFRISSDIIPFGSNTAVSFPWQTLYADELHALGEKAKRCDIRLSMHPGQYTVLNSPRQEVVANATSLLQSIASRISISSLMTESKGGSLLKMTIRAIPAKRS